MNVIPFPNSNNDDDIVFTREEANQFEDLKLKLKQSISPGEAEYYKNELDSLLSRGRARARQKKKKNKK